MWLALFSFHSFSRSLLRPWEIVLFESLCVWMCFVSIRGTLLLFLLGFSLVRFMSCGRMCWIYTFAQGMCVDCTCSREVRVEMCLRTCAVFGRWLIMQWAQGPVYMFCASWQWLRHLEINRAEGIIDSANSFLIAQCGSWKKNFFTTLSRCHC